MEKYLRPEKVDCHQENDMSKDYYFLRFLYLDFRHRRDLNIKISLTNLEVFPSYGLLARISCIVHITQVCRLHGENVACT